MKTVKIDPNGGPVTAEVRCGFAQPGSYTLLLWAANENRVLQRWDGNFINSDDDAYVLPGDGAGHDGRIVQCIATLVITPPIRDYQVDLEISQGGRVLGGDSARGSNASGAVPVTLFVELAA